MAQLLKGFCFDLTNTLARHAEHLTDLFQSVICAAADTKAHAQNALLAGRQPGRSFCD